MVNKFPTVFLVCMLKHLWREKGTSVNRQDFKLAVALYLARQLCCSPLKHTSLDPALHSSFVIGLCTIIFCFCLFFQPILYGFVQVVTSPNLCQTWVKYSLHKKWSLEVADPHPKIKDEGRSQKNLFSALCASVWSKYKGGPPPDVPLMRVQCIEYLSSRWGEGYSGIQVMGEIEWIFWLWKFCLWDFFGQENLARTFWVDWVK